MMVSPERQQAPTVEGALAHPTRAVRRSPSAWWPRLGRIALGTRRPLLRLLALGLFVTFWHLASTYHLTWYIRFVNIPPPTAVLTEALHLCMSKVFYTHIVASGSSTVNRGPRTTVQ